MNQIDPAEANVLHLDSQKMMIMVIESTLKGATKPGSLQEKLLNDKLFLSLGKGEIIEAQYVAEAERESIAN